MHITVAIVTMVTVNVGRKTNIPLALMHPHRKANYLALMGLRKYIELRENWATENYSGPAVYIPKLWNSCWKVCSGPCSYL